MPGVRIPLTKEIMEHLQANLDRQISYKKAAEAVNREIPLPGRVVTKSVVSGLVFREKLRSLRRRRWKF